jgi:hypothetical protein
MRILRFLLVAIIFSGSSSSLAQSNKVVRWRGMMPGF